MEVSVPINWIKDEVDDVFPFYDGYFDFLTLEPDDHSFTYFMRPNMAIWLQRLGYTTCTMDDLMTCKMYDNGLLRIRFGEWLRENKIILPEHESSLR